MKYSYDITVNLEFNEDVFDYAFDCILTRPHISAYTALYEGFDEYYGTFEANLFDADSNIRNEIISKFRKYTEERHQREGEKLKKIGELKNQIAKLENQIKEIENEGLL